MPIKTHYERLLEEQGKEVADAYMKELRGKVKHIPGGSFRDKKFAKEASLKGVAAKRAKREASNQGPDTIAEER